MKSYAPPNFWVKNAKNNKSLGRDLKNQFLPNKKWFSMISDGNDNLLRVGLRKSISNINPY